MRKSKIKIFLIVVLSILYGYFVHTPLISSIIIGIAVGIGMVTFSNLFKKYM